MMQVITIDFETFYSQKFSLSKMTTEEYIRVPQFEVTGVSVKVDAGETKFFSGPKAATKRFLDRFDWDNAIAIAHNAVFDMAILNWHFDIRPKRIVDTLSMLRAIDGPDAGNSLAKAAERYKLGVKGTEVINALGKRRLDFTPEEMSRYGTYCCNDADLTYDLFQRIAVGFPAVEFRLIDLTIRMFTEPVLVLDKGVLLSHLDNVKTKKAALMDAVAVDKDALMSNPKLAYLLRAMGVAPPMKVSAKTGKEAFAFAKSDEGFKALLEHPDPRVQAVAAARLGVKSTLEESRTERFIKIAERGTLPVPLRYYAAHTGRWGGDDKVNLQNLPRKSPLKKAMLAPEGYTFIDCDSSQIEARTLAWLAGQDDLVAAFDAGEDVYKIMASSIYTVPVEEVTDDQRFVGKTTILGCGYGMGAAKFKAQLKTFGVDMEMAECRRIIRVYRETYPKIPDLWDDANDVLDSISLGTHTALGHNDVLVVHGKDGIELPNGLFVKYDNVRRLTAEVGQKAEMVYDQKKGKSILLSRIYGGKLVENVCQALARIIIGEQMLMIARSYRVVMTVHDAIGVIAPTEKAVQARQFVEACMRMRPKWATALPLNCESKIGASYGG